jgi:hypothetical protein
LAQRGVSPAELFGHFGMSRDIFPAEFLGKEKGDVLIVGGGRSVWDDVAKLWPVPEAVIAVNDIGMYWPGYLKGWYSNDAVQLKAWHAGRRHWWEQIYRQTIPLHSCFAEKAGGGVHNWPFPAHGSSGLVVTLVALAMGYERLWIAGIPLDDTGHFYDPPNGHPLVRGRKLSNFENETRDRTLENLKPLLKGRIKAASGRLLEFA